MNNLTKYGKHYLNKYLRDYSAGLLRFNEVKAILECCFEKRLNIN